MWCRVGAEDVESLLLNKTEKVGSAVLRNTRFGWVLTGVTNEESSPIAVYSHFASSIHVDES